MKVYVLSTSKTSAPGRIIPNGKFLTDGGAAELIGNQDINVVEPTGVSLSKTSVTVREAESTTITATVTPSDATNKVVSWSSSNDSVATVSGGKITGVSTGTATITAKTYNGKSATCTVTVQTNPDIVKPSGITVSPTSLTITAGETGDLTATVLPSNATNKTVTWTSSDTSVATVNSSGVVTAVAQGTATITASTFNGKTATAEITVEGKQFQTVDHGFYFEKPSGWGSNINVYIYDKNASTEVSAWPGNKMTDCGDGMYSYEYQTSSSGVRIIFNDGGNQSPGSGQEGFTYTDQGVYNTSGMQYVYEKPVVVDVTSVTLSKTSLSLTKGGAATLTATVAPSNATNKTITWKSSNTSVATVTSAGKVTAVAKGSATITAKSNNGKTATCSVTVTDSSSNLVNNSYMNSENLSIGSRMYFYGAAEGGSGSYRYAFRYKRTSAKKWKVLGTEYGTEDFKFFTPTSTGDFDVIISVKDSKGNVVDKSFVVSIKDGKSTAFKNNTTISATGGKVGTKVKLVASATGSSGYKYAYYYKRTNAKAWYIIGTEFGSATAAQFTPKSVGEFNVKVDIMDKNGEIVSRQFAVSISDDYVDSTIVNKSTVNTSSAPLGTRIIVSGAATGGSGSYTYAFYYKKAAAINWTTMGTPYSSAKQAAVTLKSTGDFIFKVCVKDSAGGMTSKNLDVEITDNSQSVSSDLVNNSTVSANSITLGKAIVMTGAASGGSGSYTYAFYYKKSTASTYSVSGTEFGSDTARGLTPKATGVYDIKITVKDSTGATVDKTFAVVVK